MEEKNKLMEEENVEKKVKVNEVEGKNGQDKVAVTEENDEKRKNLKSKKEEKEIVKDKVEKKERKNEEIVKKKKESGVKIEKKDFAFAKGENIRASKKQCMYICNFIKNKPIDLAIKDLEKVMKMKLAVPFKGEIPHRKGKGMMSGRYPIKAAELFVKLLKGLKGNVLVNNMDIEKTRIKSASASWSSRPARSSNRKGKRTNVVLVAKEIEIRK